MPPHLTLPIMLDVGTNNESLIDDPLYLGLRQARATSKAYDDFIEAFVTAVGTVFPRACIQFEDFAFANAGPILSRYRDRICRFNDDIQGTASVALAGLIAALKIVGATLESATAERTLSTDKTMFGDLLCQKLNCLSPGQKEIAAPEESDKFLHPFEADRALRSRDRQHDFAPAALSDQRVLL